MTFDQVLMLGGLIAAIIAGLLGIKRGESEKRNESAARPFAQVMPTYADTQLLDRQVAATTRLADAIERLAVMLENWARREGESERTEERAQSRIIAERLSQLTQLMERNEQRGGRRA